MHKRRHNVQQRPTSHLAYRVHVTGCGTPTEVTGVLWDTTTPEWEDVTDRHVIGAPIVRGETIITGTIHSLELEHRYQLETRFSCRDGRQYGSDLVITVKE